MELYQQLIIDHTKSPRNRRRLESPDHQAQGYNPLCGDQVTVFLRLRGGTIDDVCFEGKGCAISTASASLMTQALKGKSIEDARKLFRRFHALVTDGGSGGDASGVPLGKLDVFSGVRNYPVRVKCATLAWHTLMAALDKSDEVVTTESDD